MNLKYLSTVSRVIHPSNEVVTEALRPRHEHLVRQVYGKGEERSNSYVYEY